MTLLVSFLISLLPLVPNPVSQLPVMNGGAQVVFCADINALSYCCPKEFSDITSVWEAMIADVETGSIRLQRISPHKKPVIAIENVSGMDIEEYSLKMDAGSVTLSASTPKGIWWGLQSITQILVAARCSQASDNVRIPAVCISDKPAFSYRGAHLDCSRHFFTVEEVKKFIDMMVIHKLNVFHWHLTDDQGWRFQSGKYPLLTTKGSIREQTLVGRLQTTPRVYDALPYGKGKYYTKDQMRDIVNYAAMRQIDIIPEIDMPGHMISALACYPEMGCTGGPYKVMQEWGISRDVLCLGKDVTYKFLFDIIDEVCEIFPYRYIHIGGDEAPVTRRKECPHCQAKMKELGLSKEIQLQGHLINLMEKHLKSKGREIIGWDEILDAGVSKDAIVMSWRGANGGIRAAKQGNRAVMTPNNYFYLDYEQCGDPSVKEPLSITGGRMEKKVTLEKCYSFNPYNQLGEEQKKYILGIQANTWTEYMATFEHVMHMDLPRFSALSEDAWNLKKQDYSVFKDNVVKSMRHVYDFFGFIYAPYEF